MKPTLPFGVMRIAVTRAPEGECPANPTSSRPDIRGLLKPAHCPYLAGLFSLGSQSSATLRVPGRHSQVPMYFPVSSAGRGEPRLRGRSGGLVSPGFLQSLSTLVLEDAYGIPS